MASMLISFLANLMRFRRRFLVALIGLSTISFVTLLSINQRSSVELEQVVKSFSLSAFERLSIHYADNVSTSINAKKVMTNGKQRVPSIANNSILSPSCSLPSLDPFHASVKTLIKKVGQLDCGKLHSSFHNNTLQVRGEDIVAVSYQVIIRPKLNDFGSSLSHPVVVRNSKKQKGAFLSIIPGNSGCVMQRQSKKYLHPFGGETKPKDDNVLVLHPECNLGRVFEMTADKTIKHISSGLCIHVNKNGNEVTLRQECSTKFEVLNGTLRITNTSQLCIQFKNISKLAEERVETGQDCRQEFVFRPIKGGPFDGNASVNADFVRVDIIKDKETVTEVHMQTAPKPEVLQRKVKPAGIPVNIAMIMFDSTSAANFIRQMHKTRKFLKTRPTVYLEGETIVGDGTTAQLCAMLTGIAEKDEPESRRSKPNAKVVDDWRWVFRDYAKRGYATMYSEDAPYVGTFNYRLKGFANPPTDHYGRPFWFEADKHAKKDFCSTNQPIHKITMNYFLSLFRSYPNNPKFSFLLFSDLSHSSMNTLGYADEDLVDLLKTMDKESYLDETIIFIFGDHGARHGTMRKTFQGKLEERLPHMSITFPTWFPKKYPELYKNVRQNGKLLTTPFDIYVTLQHILSYPVLPDVVTVGQSLFTPIDPQNRTCATSGVEDHWCPCMNLEKVPITSPIVKKIANYSVSFINDLLQKEKEPSKLCHRFSLKEIKTAFVELPNEKVQTFQQTKPDDICDSCVVVLGEKDENTLVKDTLYQIQFITSPNDGFFEASIKLKDGVPSVKGTISRVDTYGNQPHCIQNTYVHLLKFCYCKASP